MLKPPNEGKAPSGLVLATILLLWGRSRDPHHWVSSSGSVPDISVTGSAYWCLRGPDLRPFESFGSERR